MKKRRILLILSIALLLTACQTAGSSIRPERFSKETREILDTIGDTYFYDLKISDDMQAYTVDYWSFDGQAWTRETILYDTQLTPGNFRWGFRVEDERLLFYGDKATYTTPRTMRPEQGAGVGAGTWTLNQATPIESDTDIVLYHYILSASGTLYTGWYGNLENTEYDAGTALTVTFYDHPLEF